jgi:hypothetical protein
MAFSSTTQLMVDSTFRIPTSVKLDGQPSYFFHRKSGWEDKADGSTADYGADRDRQKFTFAIWLKRNKLTDNPSVDTSNRQHIFEITDNPPENTGEWSSGTLDRILFDHEDKLVIQFDNASDQDNVINLTTNAQFRDVSNWYHILVSVDTTESAFANRVKLYINGTRYTDFAAVAEANFPAENDAFDCMLYHPFTYQYIGGKSSNEGGNGGLSTLFANIVECHYIEDYALTPTTFGEFGKYGEFKPIKTSGITYTYQSFYHPFQEGFGNTRGFSAVTYTGNGTSQQVFTGLDNTDLVWIKRRDAAADHNIEDSNRGINLKIHSNSTAAELTGHVSAFGTDSFSVTGADSDSNLLDATYVAWCWDMGGSNATLTAGSIDTVVRANTTYGQSIVKYTGNGTSGATIAHGLGAVPDMIWVKDRDGTDSWAIFTNGAGNGKALAFDGNGVAATNSGYWNDTDPSSTLITLGNHATTNESGVDYIAYVFTDIAGYSKFAEYSANAATVGPVVDNLGFRPAMIFVKDRNVQSRQWTGPLDTARDGQGGDNYWNTGRSMHNSHVSNTDGDDSRSTGFMFTDDGFEVFSNSRDFNASGATVIYAAWADNRQIAPWKDHSGLNNHLQPIEVTQADIILDSPTNNFATLNPLNEDTEALFEGNLAIKSRVGGSGNGFAKSTMAFSSGKWYAEYLWLSGGDGGMPGISPTTASMSDGTGKYYSGASSKIYSVSGTSYTDDGSYGSSWSVGDIIGVAMDADANTLTFYKNNSSMGTAYSSLTDEYYFSNATAGGAENIGVWNFGQDSSFASHKPPQFQRDLRNQAEFYYEPPAGFLALCSNNLPEPAVVPSENFNTVLYTGSGSSQDINLGMNSDFTWVKSIGATGSHALFDSLRKTNSNYNNLASDSDSAEGETSYVDDVSTVFGLTGAGWNTNNGTYVAWNWKANGSGSSNTDGTITSTVSANVDAGFSIVSWTGNGNNGATIGHGLNAVPDMIINKKRNDSQSWYVSHEALSSTSHGLSLDTTAASAAFSYGTWGTRTSTIMTVAQGSNGLTNVNANNDTYIAYCFHSVDGYSSVGSYIGNGGSGTAGETDGSFIYTGFRTAWVMVKQTNTTNNWIITDNKRDTINPTTGWLYADLNAAEESDNGRYIDFVSNGFKIRSAGSGLNTNNGTYTYLAFAEQPFKYSNGK